MVGTFAAAEGVLRGCCLAWVGEDDGVPVRDGDALGAADVLAAGPAWNPSWDVAVPLPGETSTKAATMMPASRSGPNPKSRTLASRPRPRPQVTGRLAAPARPRRPTPRRGGLADAANGPAVGGPTGVLGYQPTVEPSSGSGIGSDGAGGRCGPPSGGNATAPVATALVATAAPAAGKAAAGKAVSGKAVSGAGMPKAGGAASVTGAPKAAGGASVAGMPKTAGAAKFAGSGPRAGGRDTGGRGTGDGEVTGAGNAVGGEAGTWGVGAGDTVAGAPKLGGIMPGLFAASGCFAAW